MSKQISRRDFIRNSGLVVATLTLPGCGVLGFGKENFPEGHATDYNFTAITQKEHEYRLEEATIIGKILCPKSRECF
ncbi:MAG: twin-arginine translocation signal domain-containing protein [Candidatus Pacearchaeota archaeon]